MVAFVCVERRPKYGACRSWPAGYQLGGGRTHAKVGVVTPSLPSVPSALRTPRLLKRNVCMFHMSPHHPLYAVLAEREYYIVYFTICLSFDVCKQFTFYIGFLKLPLSIFVGGVK